MDNNFFMKIEDVFYNQGIFVVGSIQRGAIRIWDKVLIVGENTEMRNLCISIKK